MHRLNAISIVDIGFVTFILMFVAESIIKLFENVLKTMTYIGFQPESFF